MIPHRLDMNRLLGEIENNEKKWARPNPTLFYGSSTFTFWKEIDDIFIKYNSMNCGFGGSCADEGLYYYDRIVKRYAPKVLVFYFGDNDPVCGYTVDETVELYKTIWDKAEADFPGVKIINLATKISPARVEYRKYVEEVNAWTKEYISHKDNMYYVDTYDLCFDENGEFILDDYIADQLHFSLKSYAVIEKRLKEILEKIY